MNKINRKVNGSVYLMKISSKVALLFMTILCFLSGGCASLNQEAEPKPIYVTQTYKLPQFNSIKISGNSVVHLVDGAPTAYINAEQRSLNGISVKVIDRTLYINNQEQHSVLLKLHANNAKFILVEGHAYVSSKDITLQDARIKVQGSATVTLDGKLNISRIVQAGGGKIEAKWIDSDRLAITSSGRGPVYLGGVVNGLALKLSGYANVDGRYLRAQEAAVFVTDRAHADVVALQTLRAYADEHSSVYYYKRPQSLHKVAKDSGNVFFYEELR